MLPPALTMMASLLPGVDKLAISITLEMTPDGYVISHSFNRSLINSCAQLHYSHAQVRPKYVDLKFHICFVLLKVIISSDILRKSQTKYLGQV